MIKTVYKVPTVVTAAVFLAVIGLSGCAGDRGPKETGGAVIGGVAGAIAGAQFGRGTGQLAATAAGTLLGAWIGSEVGKSLDRADRAYMEQSTATALESRASGESVAWRNPDSGNSGSVMPTSTYYRDDGTPCREFTTTITVDGQYETAKGVACRQTDGTWRVMD